MGIISFATGWSILFVDHRTSAHKSGVKAASWRAREPERVIATALTTNRRSRWKNRNALCSCNPADRHRYAGSRRFPCPSVVAARNAAGHRAIEIYILLDTHRVDPADCDGFMPLTVVERDPSPLDAEDFGNVTGKQ